MPEATFLHIQGRDDATTRVIELPVGPIRIGRGPLCEVRLADPELDEVQCMLRRRGTTWHYQPVGQPGLVWIDGRPADQQRPIAMGASLRVGESWLTLRTADRAADVLGSFNSPISVESQTVETELSPEPASAPDPTPSERPRASTVEDAEERLRRWQTRLEQREQWLKDRQDEKRWEARWKAAGESIRSRSTKPSVPTSAPSPGPVTPPTPTRPVPNVRPVEPRSTPSFQRIADPAPRPTPTRVPIRIMPGPAVTSPPIARIVPKAPAPRPLMALPAPTIDWAGTRSEPVAPRPVEVESRAVEVSIEAVPPVIEVAPAAAPVEEASAEPIEPIDESVVILEAGGASLEVFLEALPEPDLAPQVEGQAETLLVPVELETPTIEVQVESEALVPTIAVVESVEPPMVALEAQPETFLRQSETSNPEWPSARSIFAAQGSRRSPTTTEPIPRTRKRKTEASPTTMLAPACWTIPGWLGVIPIAALALGLGTLGLFLAYQWMLDQTSANLAVTIATRDEKSTLSSTDPIILPRIEWWKSTAPHLAAWAVALSRLEGEDHSEEIRIFSEAARHASPLSSTTRFAIEPVARPVIEGDSSHDLDHLGRTRDIVTLTWTGRRLRQAGKVEDSLRAYRSALAIAARTRLELLEAPSFNDDAQVRRYRLPREAILGGVVLDMVQVGKWTHEQWIAALPESADASLIAARMLMKAQDRAEADRLVELTVTRGESPCPAGFHPAEQDAAVAEALASRLRWSEASDRYQRAIERAPDDPTRRRWWINLADLAQRLGDDSLRSRALESAKSSESLDEITRQALQFQQNNPGLAVRGDRR